jgi:hypothetical protein
VKVRTVDHKPIRDKYSPRMNAVELRHKARVKEQPCFGCGAGDVDAHHTLLKFEGKRFRRDHRCLLPVCPRCHRMIHDWFGCEVMWLESMGQSEEGAIAHMEVLWAESEAA